MGNEQKVFYAPSLQIILHEIEVGRFVFSDCFYHRTVSSIRDRIPNRRTLTFKLEKKSATRTAVIVDLIAGL